MTLGKKIKLVKETHELKLDIANILKRGIIMKWTLEDIEKYIEELQLERIRELEVYLKAIGLKNDDDNRKN